MHVTVVVFTGTNYTAARTADPPTVVAQRTHCLLYSTLRRSQPGAMGPLRTASTSQWCRMGRGGSRCGQFGARSK
jgi:hypothetical protein